MISISRDSTHDISWWPVLNGHAVERTLNIPMSIRKRSILRIEEDIFQDSISDSFIDSIFGVMAATYAVGTWEQFNHTIQILTENPVRMREYLSQDRRMAWAQGARTYGAGSFDPEMIFHAVLEGPQLHPNVWLGVTIRNQAEADARLPLLLDTPASLRWVSCDPLEEDIDLAAPYTTKLFDERLEEDIATKRIPEFDGSCRMDYAGGDSSPYEDLLPGLHWVVCAGDRTLDAEPVNPRWVMYLRETCDDMSIPFFFKSWGQWMPIDSTLAPPEDFSEVFDWGAPFPTTTSYRSYRVGADRSGDLINGHSHHELPVWPRPAD